MNELDNSWHPEKMLEVQLKEPDDFLKVRETLTRIGVASRKDKKLLTLKDQLLLKVNIKDLANQMLKEQEKKVLLLETGFKKRTGFK